MAFLIFACGVGTALLVTCLWSNSHSQLGIDAQVWVLPEEKMKSSQELIDGSESLAGNDHTVVSENFSLDYYFTYGEKTSSASFSQLYVAPLEFDGELLPGASGPLIDSSGVSLTKYFALRFKTQLRLGYFNSPGDYQFALLSDDGSRMYMISDLGNREIVVNNDGLHKTHLECSVQTYYLEADSLMPVEIEYFQGPESHLSMILLWRKVDDYDTYEPLCGFPEEKHSDWFGEYYADQENFLFGELKKRGWEIVPRESFLRSESEWDEI